MAAGVLGGGPVMTAMIWTQGQSSGRGDFFSRPSSTKDSSFLSWRKK